MMVYDGVQYRAPHMGQIEELEKVHRRATKLLRECKYLRYAERLKYMDLPTLRFTRCRCDITETYKLLSNKYDSRNGLPSLQFSSNDRMKLVKSHVRYDSMKHFLTHLIVNL